MATKQQVFIAAAVDRMISGESSNSESAANAVLAHTGETINDVSRSVTAGGITRLLRTIDREYARRMAEQRTDRAIAAWLSISTPHITVEL